MSNEELLEKWSFLSKKLLKQTKEGKLDWHIDNFSGQIGAKVGAHTIWLSEIGEEGDERVLVRIEDEFEALVDRFSTRDYKGLLDYAERGVIFDLFEAARRNATNADAALDQILKDLS